MKMKHYRLYCERWDKRFITRLLGADVTEETISFYLDVNTAIRNVCNWPIDYVDFWYWLGKDRYMQSFIDGNGSTPVRAYVAGSDQLHMHILVPDQTYPPDIQLMCNRIRECMKSRDSPNLFRHDFTLSTYNAGILEFSARRRRK